MPRWSRCSNRNSTACCVVIGRDSTGMPGEGGCGSDGTIGQFNAKGSFTEFQVLKAFTRGLAYPADLLLYIGSLRGYWRNDIGFTGCNGQHTATGTADKDGKMWLLHRSGNRA